MGSGNGSESSVCSKDSVPNATPKELLLNKLYAFHVRGGHPEAERLYALYRRLYNSNDNDEPRVTKAEIQRRIQACPCFTAKQNRRQNFVPVHPSINKELFIDFKEIGTNRCPIPGMTKRAYRLTITEPLSGAVWSLPIPVCNGTELVRLMRIVLQIHGLVHSIRPDNAPAFIHGEFAEFCKLHGIQIKPIRAYNAQANLAERPHSAINRLINNISTSSKNIDEDIFCFVTSHNLLPKSLGFSPIEVLKGGHIPPECVEDFTNVQPKQSELSASQFLAEVWEKRNLSKLDKTQPSSEAKAFERGTRIKWQAQINPGTFKTAKGVVVDSTPTACLIRFDNNRLAWAVSSQIKLDQSANIGNALAG